MLATAHPKPRRSVKTRRANKARHNAQKARRIKAAVKVADGGTCRWAGCETPPDTFWGQLEVAHLQAAGMGGDPQLRRMVPENLITLCRWHHQGPHGLHSGQATIDPVTEQGTRGPVFCLRLVDSQWVMVGFSRPPGA